MSLLKRTKKTKEQPVEKAKAVKAPGSSSIGGLLAAAGLEKPESNAPDPELARMETWWVHLRGRIDQGARQFFEEGKTAILEDHVDRPLLDAVVRHLQSLKAQDLVWIQPRRKSTTNPRFNIFAVEKDSESGQPTAFTVRETFQDNSRYIKVANEEIIDQEDAAGDQVTLEARVHVHRGSKFRLVSVVTLPSI